MQAERIYERSVIFPYDFSLICNGVERKNGCGPLSLYCCTCTLVAVWLRVPRRPDRTTVGTNGCPSKAPRFAVPTNYESSPGPAGGRTPPFRLRPLPHLLLLLLPLLPFGFGACKWHHSHFSVLHHHSARGGQRHVFQCNLFIFLFLRAV